MPVALVSRNAGGAEMEMMMVQLFNSRPRAPLAGSMKLKTSSFSRILTDSNYLVEMDEDSKTITFKAATISWCPMAALSRFYMPFSAARGVRVTDKILVSRSSKEYGSTYKKLVCEACDCDLGKQYLTTPQQLDSARSRYCFNVSALESYEVGRLEEMAENSPLESFGILQRLRVRHTQMMQILIQFDKRIKLLEERRLHFILKVWAIYSVVNVIMSYGYAFGDHICADGSNHTYDITD
eukprot:jgi/Bigna1/144816/aug1.91_g19524